MQQGWCLRDAQSQEWWCVTEVMAEGLIRATNERDVRHNVDPLVFKRINDDGHGHDAKRQPARFVQAVLNRHGHWAVPRHAHWRRDSCEQRQELVLVGARYRQLVSEPDDERPVLTPTASHQRPAPAGPLMAYMAIVLC